MFLCRSLNGYLLPLIVKVVEKVTISKRNCISYCKFNYLTYICYLYQNLDILEFHFSGFHRGKRIYFFFNVSTSRFLKIQFIVHRWLTTCELQLYYSVT